MGLLALEGPFVVPTFRFVLASGAPSDQTPNSGMATRKGWRAREQDGKSHALQTPTRHIPFLGSIPMCEGPRCSIEGREAWPPLLPLAAGKQRGAPRRHGSSAAVAQGSSSPIPASIPTRLGGCRAPGSRRGTPN